MDEDAHKDCLITDQTVFSEQTLQKVHDALLADGYKYHEIIRIITLIQNEGILFRERLPDAPREIQASAT